MVISLTFYYCMNFSYSFHNAGYPFDPVICKMNTIRSGVQKA